MNEQNDNSTVTCDNPGREKMWVAVILTLISVVLLMLALPPLRLSVLAWLALVPFLVAVRGQGAKRGAVLGLILGWTYCSALLYWLIRFGAIAPIGAGLIKSVIFVALGAILGAMRPRTGLVYAFTVACAWLGQEYLESSGSLGFTLGMLANTQARHPIWLQINTLLGPWTLSFVLAFVNASLANFTWKRRWQRRDVSLSLLCWACACVVATFGFGLWRLNTYQLESDKAIKIGLVQLSAPQSEKFSPEKAPLFLDELFEMSQKAADEGCNAVIWPETSMPYFNFTRKRSVMRKVRNKVSQLGTWCLVGSVARENGKKYNRMYSFDPEGNIVDTYDKYHLVPFGEFLPLEKYWPDWRILDQIMRMTAGDGVHTVQADNCRLGLMICFESMTTTVPRAQVRNGADVLVVPTNDAWFGTSNELPMHFDMAIMRAVETGRYTMQVGNTGITGFVTPLGEVLQETEPEEKAVISERVFAHSEMTPYMRIGDIFPCLAMMWVVIFMFDSIREPKRYWVA